MRSPTSHLRRPFLHPEHPAPDRSPPLSSAPSLPRRGPPASPPSRRPFCQRAIPLRGNTASQSRHLHSQSPPTAFHIPSRNPCVLPFRSNTDVTAICLSSRAPLAYKVIQMSAHAKTGTVLDRIL